MKSNVLKLILLNMFPTCLRMRVIWKAMISFSTLRLFCIHGSVKLHLCTPSRGIHVKAFNSNRFWALLQKILCLNRKPYAKTVLFKKEKNSENITPILSQETFFTLHFPSSHWKDLSRVCRKIWAMSTKKLFVFAKVHIKHMMDIKFFNRVPEPMDFNAISELRKRFL